MSFFINNALAQTAPAAPGAAPATVATTEVATQSAGAPPPQPGTLGMLMPFALMFGVIYFLIIRPQQKKMREQQDALSLIKHGDEIITNGGLIGKVTGVTERVLTVEISDGVRVKVLKSQVASVNLDLTAPLKSNQKAEAAPSR